LESDKKREWGIGILRGNLLILVVCRCIWMFTTSIPRPYLSLYIRELGGTSAAVGLVNSLSSLAGLFLYPLGGYIADSRGRVKLVGAATFLYAISFLPFAFSPSWEWLAAASFFQNLVLFYSPILTAIQADSMPPGQRGTGFAIALAIPGALGIVSPYIGGYLVDAWGVIDACKVTYSIGFGAGIIVALLRTFKLKETLEVTSERLSIGDAPRIIKESYSSFVETLKWLPKSLRNLAILQVIYSFFISLAGPFWILYGQDVIGLSASEWGLLSLVAGGIRFVFAIPAGKIMDRYGRRRVIIPMMLITPLLPFFFIYARGFWDLVINVTVMAVTNAFLMPGVQSLVADYTPRDRRGRVLSTIGSGNFYLDIRTTRIGGGMLIFVPSTIAFYTGGAIYEMSNSSPFIVLTAGLVLTAIWFILRVQEPETLEV
jgi:DHA1 family multidrug resistance protein-like MFS transporter